MSELQELIEQKAKELALQYTKIIEDEIKKAINKFDCKPEDLILEYSGHTKVNIRLRVSEFQINNHFIWDKT